MTSAPVFPSEGTQRYVAQLAHFWQLDAQQAITITASRVYCYLLHQAYQADWPLALPLSRRQLSSALTMPPLMVRATQTVLERRGLAVYEAKSPEQPAHWLLLNPSTPPATS